MMGIGRTRWRTWGVDWSRPAGCTMRSGGIEACDAFVAVDEVEPLGAEDLELLAESAQVMGRGELAVATLRRAYEARVGSGDVDRAITIGFWLWQALVINGEFSRAGGWASLMRALVGRAPEGRGAEPSETDGTERGLGMAAHHRGLRADRRRPLRGGG